MSLLLIDIGNTRVKWAILRDAKMSRMRALPHAGKWDILPRVVRGAGRKVDGVLAVCVAGKRFERALAAAVRRQFGLPVDFVRSTRQAGGVRNGYRDPWRLGADRWVGVIAARALAGARGALVVNAGTALTLDVVDAHGRHRGGAIAPGPTTMIASLMRGTSGIRRRAQGAAANGASLRGLFAADTARALRAGASYASAALVDRAVREARASLGGAPRVLLTGGAVRLLRPYIKSPVRLVPDLVLRGLAVLARADGPRKHV
jgi:type III pantothenate kinase